MSASALQRFPLRWALYGGSPFPPLLPPLQNGTIPANGVVGRLLMETLSKVPQVEPSKYEAMLNATMQVSC